MTKKSHALVMYESSSDECSEAPERKKRKLPSLSSTFLTPIPIDRPQLHQGRSRTQPHVEGQWAAHVYVSLILQRHSPLNMLINDVLTYAREMAPTLHDFWNGDLSIKRELHISLSRPIYLRTHQREGLKKAVKDLSMRFSPFQVSFATFSELHNDEHTRTFLTMEIGAGHHELRAMCDALTPTLEGIRQKEFYTDPRFHSSIAWALLETNSERSFPDASSGSASTDPQCTNHVQNDSSESGLDLLFPTIPHLPKDLVPALNERFSTSLTETKTGVYEVETITVKIGKEHYTWRLLGD